MRTMTLEELLMKEDDATLLPIYWELESRVVPATGYAHAYCRKVNKLINAGQLCTVQDKYRNVYLPTLSKMIFKEMSRRYAQVLYNEKSITSSEPADDELVEPDDMEDEDLAVCEWCSLALDRAMLHRTNLGRLCDKCIEAIRSRGERVTVYD